MSKPSLKKKRTILDFFTKPGKKNSDGPVSKKRKIMASSSKVESDAVSGATAAEPSTSDTVPVNWDSISDGEEVNEEDMDSQKSDMSTGSDRIPVKKPSQKKDGSNAWKGMPLNMFHTLATTTKDKHQIEGNRDNHRVLFKTPWKYDGKSPPKPYPTYKDKWDHNYVRLPCSNQNEYPCTDKYGKATVRRRWDIIQEELLKDIPGPYELEERILMYNSRYFGKWKFTVLHEFFRFGVEEEERDHFFSKGVKDIARLALQLPHICTAPIPLLREKHNFSVTFSQQQIACLLANAFFCTFPRRNTSKGKSEYSKFPNINFNSLYTGPASEVKFEKIRCILHYFRRVSKKREHENTVDNLKRSTTPFHIRLEKNYTRHEQNYRQEFIHQKNQTFIKQVSRNEED